MAGLDSLWIVVAAVCLAMLGCAVFWRWLFPSPPALEKVLFPERVDSGEVQISELVDSWSVSVVKRLGGLDDYLQLESDCFTTEVELVTHCRERVVTGVGGALALFVVGAVTGVSSPDPVLSPIILFVLFYVLQRYVGASLHARAEEQRLLFSRVTLEMMGLVVVSMTGGMGINSSLYESCSVVESPEWRRIRAALEDADLSGVSSSSALTALGAQMRVDHLERFGETLEFAADSGATPRAALTSRMRQESEKQLTEELARAKRASERMDSITSAMALALVAFFAYPAVVGIISI